MSKKTSGILNATKYIEDISADSLTLSDLQSLLAKRHIDERLYTHPIILSFLRNLLSRFPTLSLTQMDSLLKDIMSVSSWNNSISIVFNNEHHEKLFTYKLQDNILIYTKQFFIKDNHTTVTKYFDKSGSKIKETETLVEKICEPPSYRTEYYDKQIKEEDYSL